MKFSIVTDYPLIFIIFCVLLAGSYAFFLYRNDRSLTEIKKWQIYMLATFRFLTVFILSFLLLGPMIKTISKTIENPIIIFAQDNSKSVIINKDSTFYRNEYKEKIKNFIQKFSSDYILTEYLFGENLRKGNQIDFSDKMTDFSDFFGELENKYSNRNVGALIIASDGIYNKGRSPLYASGNFRFPVYTVALGDTGLQKDAVLTQVKANKIAFLGNTFPLQVYFEAYQLKGKNTMLEVLHNGTVVFSKELTINKQNFSQIVDIELEAKAKGIQRYILKVKTIKGEVNLINNRKDIIIDIIDSKQKILILAHSPHPDIGAIKRILETNPNYEVEFFPVSSFIGAIEKYNLIIFHQLPSVDYSITNLLSKWSKTEIPGLFINGTQTDLRKFNAINLGVKIEQQKKSYDESQAFYNSKFTFFELNNDIQTIIKQAPPLICPFGNYNVSNTASVLLYQKIKNVETQTPFMIFNRLEGEKTQKIAVITGEGIWKWKLYNYRQNQNHNEFNSLITKTIQYLSLKVKKENFSVHVKKVMNENEMIIFEAEVYNESFEPIDDAVVSLEITNKNGQTFDFVFAKDKFETKTYSINAGTFPVGDYTYKAQTQVGEKFYEKTGRFSVIPIDLEVIHTIANHKILYQIAEKFDGKMVPIAALNDLHTEIENNPNIAPISYIDKSLKDLIHLKWIFFVLLTLLSLEWFWRKFHGGY